LFRVFGWFFVACGVTSLVACAYLTYASVRFSRHAVATEGSVTELVRGGRTKGGQDLFRPVVQFQTQAGERKEFASRTASSPPPHRVGDRVPVRYMPDDPEAAVIYYSVWSLWLFPLIAFLLGPVFVVLGRVFIKMKL
jgi:hypothetical protein